MKLCFSSVPNQTVMGLETTDSPWRPITRRGTAATTVGSPALAACTVYSPTISGAVSTPVIASIAPPFGGWASDQITPASPPPLTAAWKTMA